MFCEMSFAQRNIFNIHAKNYTKDTLETAKLYEYQKQNNWIDKSQENCFEGRYICALIYEGVWSS